MKRNKLKSLCLVTLLLAAAPIAAEAQPVAKKYLVTALPTFCDPERPDDESKCGLESYAYNINNDGVVVGMSQGPLVVDSDDIDDDGDTTEEIRLFDGHGFRWLDGVLVDVGHLGRNGSIAFGINDNGFVVGRSNVVTAVDDEGEETVQLRPFVSDGANTISRIEDPEESVRLGSALSIANSGHVVGYFEALLFDNDTAYYQRGFIKFPNSEIPVLIPSLQEKTASVLRAVNDVANAAVGYAIKDGVQRSIWVDLGSPGTVTELSDLGGSASSVSAINDSGVVVGRSQTTGNTSTEGFIYSAAASPNVRSIGLLDSKLPFSSANDINNSGIVVGSALAALSPNRYHAVAFDSEDSSARLIDLNDRIDCSSNLDDRWTLVEALAINDSGQIIGYGSLGTSAQAFVLTPLENDTEEPIPCAPIDGEFENNSGGGAFAIIFLPLLLLLRRRS